MNVQHLDDLRGKIIRIDPDTGAGVPGNPWYDAARPAVGAFEGLRIRVTYAS